MRERVFKLEATRKDEKGNGVPARAKGNGKPAAKAKAKAKPKARPRR
jgi:hypothetical protein